jgi:hypothetical protein
MNRLKIWCLLQGKFFGYLSIVIFLVFLLFWIGQSWVPFPINILIGVIDFGFIYHLICLADNIADSPISDTKLNKRKNSIGKEIDISSGNYNESLNIQGDYVQGDKYVNTFENFNFSQDPSQAIEEIRAILADLTQEFGDRKYAQQKVADDLVLIIRQDNNLKENLDLWLEEYESKPTVDTAEAVEKVLDIINLENKNSFWKFSIESEKSKKRYRKLIYLLKTAQWHEADDETVAIIERLMPCPQQNYGCSNICVSEITPRELKAINKIWLEASGGRFGFSIQKRIWHRIKKLNVNRKFNTSRSEYDMFAELVGWSNDMSRIYHADFDYKITNPKGHLPAKILLLETYNPNSKYCSLSACLFDEFMEREYSDFSFLPDWLRQWLLLD